jgi:hypothetical protein
MADGSFPDVESLRSVFMCKPTLHRLNRCLSSSDGNRIQNRESGWSISGVVRAGPSQTVLGGSTARAAEQSESGAMM